MEEKTIPARPSKLSHQKSLYYLHLMHWVTGRTFSKTECDFCFSCHGNSFHFPSPTCSLEDLFGNTVHISSLLRGNWKAGVTHVPHEHCEPVQRRVPSLARQCNLGQIILTSMADEEPEDGEVGLSLFFPPTCDSFIQVGFSARKTDWQPAGPPPTLSLSVSEFLSTMLVNLKLIATEEGLSTHSTSVYAHHVVSVSFIAFATRQWLHPPTICALHTNLQYPRTWMTATVTMMAETWVPAALGS